MCYGRCQQNMARDTTWSSCLLKNFPRALWVLVRLRLRANCLRPPQPSLTRRVAKARLQLISLPLSYGYLLTCGGSPSVSLSNSKQSCHQKERATHMVFHQQMQRDPKKPFGKMVPAGPFLQKSPTSSPANPSGASGWANFRAPSAWRYGSCFFQKFPASPFLTLEGEQTIQISAVEWLDFNH